MQGHNSAPARRFRFTVLQPEPNSRTGIWCLRSAWAIFTQIQNESISIVSPTKSRSNLLSLEVRDSQRGTTMAEYALISPCSRAPATADERPRRRKTSSFAAVAALLLLAIGTSACLYTPAIPDDPTPIPGWDENRSQLQGNGIKLQQSAEGHNDASSEVASSVAAKPSPATP